jgi:alpha-L-fucosidase
VRPAFKILQIILFINILVVAKSYGQASTKTDWFKNAKYGLLVHYLFGLQNGKEPWNLGKVTSWDSCVNSFNVKKFAFDVAQTGAGYVIFTTQQNSQYFSCPNTTFERITGYPRGTATPRRDLINEIATALRARGIALMLYVTGNGPFVDGKSMKALTRNKEKMRRDKTFGDVLEVNKDFLDSWSLILKDISLRYKEKVKGWWVDGAYPFIGYNDTLLTVLSKALKAGNKNAIVAFNPAPKDTVSYYTILDDFTAGEMFHKNTFPRTRFLKQAQWHAVTFLGADWGQPGLRYSGKEIEDYIIACNKKGGVVTLDVCLLRDGSLDIDQKDALKKITGNIRKAKS